MEQEITREFFAPKVVHLPSPLLYAIRFAITINNGFGINMSAKRGLAAILHFVSITNLKKAVFASRETLLSVSQIGSLSSLYRALNTLEKEGFIVREQIRYRSGSYHISRITLTDKAIELLNLKELIKNPPSTIVEDAYNERSNPPQSLQNTTGKPGASEVQGYNRQHRLPQDLVRLLQLRLKNPAIYKLMKMATQNGKKLSDIVDVVWHNLCNLEGRDAFAYLQSLIERDVDFSFTSRQIREKAAENEAKEDVEDFVGALDETYDEALVYDNSGTFQGVYRFHSNGGHVEFAHGSAPIRMVAQEFMEGLLKLEKQAASDQAEVRISDPGVQDESEFEIFESSSCDDWFYGMNAPGQGNAGDKPFSADIPLDHHQPPRGQPSQLNPLRSTSEFLSVMTKGRAFLDGIMAKNVTSTALEFLRPLNSNQQ